MLFRRALSRAGMACQLKIKFQSNPPTDVVRAEEYVYWSEESLRLSMTGITTLDLFRAIRSNNGSNQPKNWLKHSFKWQKNLLASSIYKHWCKVTHLQSSSHTIQGNLTHYIYIRYIYIIIYIMPITHVCYPWKILNHFKNHCHNYTHTYTHSYIHIYHKCWSDCK